jgi:hypothetical protein
MKPKCCIIRDASLGVKGGCKRPAKVKFGGACNEDHAKLVLQYEPVKQQAALYVAVVEKAKKDNTGVWAKKADEQRLIILQTHRDCLLADTDEQCMALEEQMVAAAEAAKAARKRLAESDRAKLLAEKKRVALAASQQELELEPPKKRRRTRAPVGQQGMAGDENGMDDEEYGNRNDDRDADEEYEEGIE